ncbi:MAG: hypothetical protein WCB68_07605 [Pyrinomonadaceae bacterium]
MKTLQKLLAAALLTLFLAMAALADDGHIDCPGIASTPPPPVSVTADGQMGCPGVAQSMMLALETVFLLA